MLQIRNVSYQAGGNDILTDINWTINPGRRIALIGNNGAGKTTMLRLLNGDAPLSSGDIVRPREYRIGYLPQEEVAVGKGAILPEVLQGHKELLELETEILDIQQQLEQHSGDNTKLVERLGDLTHRFEVAGGYTLEARAKKILVGLGFSDGDFNRPLSSFSGGWRMRVHLARLLLQDPDLLLLDEPTNHLDIESLEWLESYLLDYEGSIVFVSHDRFFIDRLAQEIVEIENRRLTSYPGNYHFFEDRKALNREQLIKKAEEIREERERLRKFIERFRYKATKAAQVQSRVKMLEKLEEIELPGEERQIEFRISCPVKSYHEVCRIDSMHFRYDIKPVLSDLSLNIYRGEKIALVGINGAGKTTMTRLLTGQLQPVAGTVGLGERVQVGYYAQHQIDTLNLDRTVLQEVSESADPAHRTSIRDILGMFRFTGEEVDKKIAVLSGGEKARVSLAKILLSPVNFLIMDEPTNHLDARSREALEKALNNYEGTLLVISHDRYFLDKLVSRVVELRDAGLTVYEGNYSDYLLRRKKVEPISESQASASAKNDSGASAPRSDKDRERQEAEARQRISGQRKELAGKIEILESQIEQLESEKSELEVQMADPDFYKNEQRAADAGKRYQEVSDLIPVRMQEWESAQEELENLLESLK